MNVSKNSNAVLKMVGQQAGLDVVLSSECLGIRQTGLRTRDVWRRWLGHAGIGEIMFAAKRLPRKELPDKTRRGRPARRLMDPGMEDV